MCSGSHALRSRVRVCTWYPAVQRPLQRFRVRVGVRSEGLRV